jgi:small subunit ribosomal protein S3
MAQKTSPTLLRLGITYPWKSRWFFKKPLQFFLEEDYLIRNIVREKVLHAGIAEITIDRTADATKVNIKAARPGLIIGRGGKGIEELKQEVEKKVRALQRKNNQPQQVPINLNVEELRRSEVSASVVAQQIAADLERRMPFRLVLRRHRETLEQRRGVKGAKIRVSGRLNGAEIARTEHAAFGRMPTQTLRANIDYGEETAVTTYGAIGVKVWLYTGDIFDEDQEQKK